MCQVDCVKMEHVNAKHQAASSKLYEQQAAGSKQQAASNKEQAGSSKQQAASSQQAAGPTESDETSEANQPHRPSLTQATRP